MIEWDLFLPVMCLGI